MYCIQSNAFNDVSNFEFKSHSYQYGYLPVRIDEYHFVLCM